MITKYSNFIKESKTIDSYFLQTYDETKSWLDSMGIENYTINDDLTVDVDDNVYIGHRKLTKIPVQFNKVKGDFSCNYNNLTSLKGCPKIVNEFYCQDNPLEDITDLDSKLLIESINNGEIWLIKISTDLYDNYFEHWITKDTDIISVLKDKVSDDIKDKYKHLFNANNFDLL